MRPMIRKSAWVLAMTSLTSLASPAWAGGKSRGAKSSDDLPVIAPGGTCESAASSYVEEYDLKKKGAPPPDLTANDFGAILNEGTYLSPCDVPPQMALDLCVAVQGGRAVGVTVKTTPADETIEACVATQLRALEFPSAPRMDVAKTHFDPEKKEREATVDSAPLAPPPAAPPPKVPPTSGCGCGSSSPGGHAGLVAALALLALLPLRRVGRES